MIIDNEIRQTPFYKQMENKLKEGYFIEKSVNTSNNNKNKVVLYTFKRINEDGTKSINSYLSYDVAKAVSKEFNTQIIESEKETVWLNDNPEHYKPHPGHKITFH